MARSAIEAGCEVTVYARWHRGLAPVEQRDGYRLVRASWDWQLAVPAAPPARRKLLPWRSQPLMFWRPGPVGREHQRIDRPSARFAVRACSSAGIAGSRAEFLRRPRAGRARGGGRARRHSHGNGLASAVLARCRFGGTTDSRDVHAHTEYARPADPGGRPPPSVAGPARAPGPTVNDAYASLEGDFVLTGRIMNCPATDAAVIEADHPEALISAAPPRLTRSADGGA
jgi:hypothetical protein